MKHSKPINSATNNSLRPPREINSRAQLRELQRVMTGALFRPLTAKWGMQKRWTDGAPMEAVASEFIKPNDRLSSFERLEIYNRQYWFRILDCLYDDYPGLRAVVGERKFMKLATAYLSRYPSDSYTLRDLGNRLEQFLREEPQLECAATGDSRSIWSGLSGHKWSPSMVQPSRRLRQTTFSILRLRSCA